MKSKKNYNKKKVFVIAEAGVAHFGSIKKAKKLVDLAHYSGADAVKFQAYVTKDLIHIKFKEWFQRYKSKEVDYNFYETVKEYCDKLGIEFMLTPHTASVLNWVKKLKCKKIKIGSGELGNFSFIQKIISLKKPIILSTGMYNFQDLKKIKKFFLTKKFNNVTFLKCRTSYPTKDNEVNLKNFIKFKNFFKEYNVGYSDHTNHDLAIYGSVFLGAKIVEKHISLDFNLKNSQDWKVSFDKLKLKKMVENIRRIEKIMGDENAFITKSEKKSKAWATRSIFSSEKILKDSKFSRLNLKTLRPGLGISAENIDKIIGKKAKNNIGENNLIKLSDYE
jgi:N-acetylneuraminate synthase/N,N'-diacetyllegionaminate synthase